MSKRVYFLKRATPKMKYHHMLNVMEFKKRLREPSDTDTILLAIVKITGKTDSYHRWFRRIYDLHRFTNPAKYRKAILNKYYYERRKEKP